MSRGVRSVLVFEDDDTDGDILDIFQHIFERSQAFTFHVALVQNPDDVSLALLGDPSDVYVVDLDLETRGPFDKTVGADFRLGHLVIETLAIERLGALIIAFSASDTSEDVVRAMRLGATDFVRKGGPQSIEELRKRIETHLNDAERRAREMRELEERHSRAPESAIFRPVPPDRFIVCAGARRVASGPNRFDALNAYRKARQDNPILPARPIIMELAPREPSEKP